MTNLKAAVRALSVERPGRFLRCPVRVESAAVVSPSFQRVTLVADGFAGYTEQLPADAFRLFPGGVEEPVAGSAAGAVDPGVSRAFTVRSFDPAANRLVFDAHVHHGGLTARWLDGAADGGTAELIGMRVEFVPGPIAARVADTVLLLADLSGLPAVAAILTALSPDQSATVVISGAVAGDQPLLPARPGDDVRWVPAGGLVDAVGGLPRPSGVAAGWVASEAGEVRAIRRLLLDELGVDRTQLHAAAYWKRGSSFDDLDAQNARRYAEAIAAGHDVTDPAVLEELAFS
ncbi:siderophore-interacting protein [Frankia sp. Ag45/Mut15]|uniref:Siderophore-interacting protein n=1 Tax=Frankia umida TaxID=573489 RepID=A0ABT0JRT9_9ACTN|nr:siderophore-interacting protein [Frankia umida]MCK9874247.1 siderophore-interacting protein [Frankia umida]